LSVKKEAKLSARDEGKVEEGKEDAECYYVLTCATIRTRTRLGDRSFSVVGPCLWNSLPVALRDRDISLVQIRDF